MHHAQGGEERRFLGSASKPRSTVSPDLVSKSVVTVLVLWSQNHPLRFLNLCIKTDICGLVIWSTKSPRQFLGLDLKTKWKEVCQFMAQNR
jgi:hypothetical protein